MNIFQKIHAYFTRPYTIDLDNVGPLPDGETPDEAVAKAKQFVTGDVKAGAGKKEPKAK